VVENHLPKVRRHQAQSCAVFTAIFDDGICLAKIRVSSDAKIDPRDIELEPTDVARNSPVYRTVLEAELHCLLTSKDGLELVAHHPLGQKSLTGTRGLEFKIDSTSVIKVLSTSPVTT